MESNLYDVIVIGGGPAGLTAGIYLSRAKAKVLILNEGITGGQMVLTHKIANYPGISSISGYMLAKTMENQATKFGCDIKSNIMISDLKLNGLIKEIQINKSDVFKSKSVIIATGGKSRLLNVSGEKEFTGRGISYCATCDGDFFQDKNIIVIGGGNSALEEAVSLTQYAKKVTIVHQFDHFQAHEHAVKEAKNNEKINFIMESEIVEFSGQESLSDVKIKNIKSKEIAEIKTEGAFVFIGYTPQTNFIKDKVNLNNFGEIKVDNRLQTNIKGVFAAGDVRVKKIRQITTATSDGTIAALNALDYIKDLRPI